MNQVFYFIVSERFSETVRYFQLHFEDFPVMTERDFQSSFSGNEAVQFSVTRLRVDHPLPDQQENVVLYM